MRGVVGIRRVAHRLEHALHVCGSKVAEELDGQGLELVCRGLDLLSAGAVEGASEVPAGAGKPTVATAGAKPVP